MFSRLSRERNPPCEKLLDALRFFSHEFEKNFSKWEKSGRNFPTEMIFAEFFALVYALHFTGANAGARKLCIGHLSNLLPVNH